MTDQRNNDLARELREGEKLANELTRLFGSLQPPFAAEQRLQAKLAEVSFHESELTLDDAGPFSFEQAARLTQDAAGSDLLAAGLEEQEIEDDEASEEE